MRCLYRILFLLILCINLFSGCAFSMEKSGVSADDPRIDFETFDKGFTYLENNNWLPQKSGYDDEVIIDSLEELKELESELGVCFSEDVNFDEYMLYVTFSGSFGYLPKLSSYDIKEIAYNDNNLVVIISYDNCETIEAKNEEWICFYNISKIKKSDFPYESRNYMCVQEKEK